MEYLWLFLLGFFFDRWFGAVLDILLEWFKNIISYKVSIIQSNMMAISKDTEDYCKDSKESGMTHAIGFSMNEAEEFIGLDDDDEEYEDGN